MLSPRHFNGDILQSHQTPKGTIWIPAEPLQGPLLGRLRDAWEVICGRAHGVQWPKTEDEEDV